MSEAQTVFSAQVTALKAIKNNSTGDDVTFLSDVITNLELMSTWTGHTKDHLHLEEELHNGVMEVILAREYISNALRAAATMIDHNKAAVDELKADLKKAKERYVQLQQEQAEKLFEGFDV